MLVGGHVPLTQRRVESCVAASRLVAYLILAPPGGHRIGVGEHEPVEQAILPAAAELGQNAGLYRPEHADKRPLDDKRLVSALAVNGDVRARPGGEVELPISTLAALLVLVHRPDPPRELVPRRQQPT